MSYQQRSGTQRGFDRPKKTKSKKTKTHHSSGVHYEENRSLTSNEIVDRTILALENLGAQTLAIAPFHQHFETWLKSLQIVLNDLESSHIIEPDNMFREESKRLISTVEEAFKAEQAKETSREAIIISLQASKDPLINEEQEYNKKLGEHNSHRDTKLKALAASVKALKSELNDVKESKAGFLEGITKSKAKKEQELSSKLIDVEKEQEKVNASFAEELSHLKAEHEHEMKEILEKLATKRSEVDRLVAESEIDNSAEVRQVTCEKLKKSVKDLVKRIEASSPEKTEKNNPKL